MGIYSSNAIKLYEYGLVTFPCTDKRPSVGTGWQKYCDQSVNEETILSWEKHYQDSEQIGLTLGKTNGIVVFDFDYDFDPNKCKISRETFNKDKELIERQIKALLPLSPCMKVGKKGWSAFYKWNESLDERSNLSSERNGVRVFDFLSWHKHTVIPPSFHSIYKGINLYYQWQGQPIYDCKNDLPEITLDIIKDIKALTSDGITGFGGRHGTLLKILLQISEVETNKENLIKYLVNKDKEIHPIPYLTDPKHNNNCRDANKNAEKWISRVLKWKIAKQGEKKTKKNIGNDSWDYFFENIFDEHRKEFLSGDIFFKNKDDESWIEALLIDGTLRSYAQNKGLPRQHLLDELNRWTFEKKDRQLLVDIPEWDKNDRLLHFSLCLESDMFNSEDIYNILREWGSGIFRKIYDKEYQNRCLILKGPQGLGKDAFVEAMLKDFKPYYSKPALVGDTKNILGTIIRKLIIHIEEFDQTSNIPIPFLKWLITSSETDHRDPYARTSTNRAKHASFISTANIDDILRDPTGNRRFVLIPVTNIKWEYPRYESIQVYAQFKHLYENKFIIPKETENKIRAIIETYTPDNPSLFILDDYVKRLKDYAMYKGIKEFNYTEIGSIINEVAKLHGVSVRRVQGVIKSNKLQKKTSSGPRYILNS